MATVYYTRFYGSNRIKKKCLQALLCFDSQKSKNTRYLGKTQSPITSIVKKNARELGDLIRKMFQADTPL